MTNTVEAPERATLEIRIGMVWVVDSRTNEWHSFTGPNRLMRALEVAARINGGE